MRKISVLFAVLAFPFAALYAASSNDLDSALPLLQAKTRTAAQTRQVWDLFSSSKNPNTVFAAGASLVRLPPPSVYETHLLNILIKNSDTLKKIFSAVILTSMGVSRPELSSLLQNAVSSQDRAVRAYAAAAYTVLNPQTDIYQNEVVNLYIYDPAFAQRAMNLISSNEKQTFKRLKTASGHQDAQVRSAAAAWLGDLQQKDASKHLLKMAKTELDRSVSSAVASALAKNKQWTLEETAKGLKTSYTAPAAATYALALGFMTGNAVRFIQEGLKSPQTDVRINSARAAAYMAGVLASEDAFLYTQDKTFDVSLLKSLIPQLTALVKKDQDSVKVYADGALKQIAKLR